MLKAEIHRRCTPCVLEREREPQMSSRCFSNPMEVSQAETHSHNRRESECLAFQRPSVQLTFNVIIQLTVPTACQWRIIESTCYPETKKKFSYTEKKTNYSNHVIDFAHFQSIIKLKCWLYACCFCQCFAMQFAPPPASIKQSSQKVRYCFLLTFCQYQELMWCSGLGRGKPGFKSILTEAVKLTRIWASHHLSAKPDSRDCCEDKLEEHECCPS